MSLVRARLVDSSVRIESAFSVFIFTLCLGARALSVCPVLEGVVGLNGENQHLFA